MSFEWAITRADVCTTVSKGAIAQSKLAQKQPMPCGSKETFFPGGSKEVVCLVDQKKLFAWWIEGKYEGVLALCAEGKLKRGPFPCESKTSERGLFPCESKAC